MKPIEACYYLQNKSWFVHPPADRAQQPETLSTPCWCLRTHEAIGPDGELACVQECTGARSCYRPEVEL